MNMTLISLLAPASAAGLPWLAVADAVGKASILLGAAGLTCILIERHPLAGRGHVAVGRGLRRHPCPARGRTDRRAVDVAADRGRHRRAVAPARAAARRGSRGDAAGAVPPQPPRDDADGVGNPVTGGPDARGC